MAKTELTQEEKEYLEIVKRLVKNNHGELEGERPLLDRQREFFGVSDQRAKQIEAQVVSAYQKFLQRHPQIADRSSFPATSSNGSSSAPGRRSAYSEPLSDLGLSASHDDFEDDAIDQFTPTFLPPSTPPAQDLPPTVVPPPAPVASTQLAATTLSEQPELEQALHDKRWQQADQITLKMMLKMTEREAQGWLDAEAITRLPCASLHEIDRLWRKYSHEKFGFTPQWQVFAELERSPLQQSNRNVEPRSKASQQPLFNSNAPRSAELDYQKMLRFCKALGWWQWGEFHKYYNQLDFRKYDAQPALALGKEVPRGHLPALWYWQIPWWRALQLGGIGASRGGCCVDASVLVAFMTQLQECEIPSNSGASSDRSMPSRPLR